MFILLLMDMREIMVLLGDVRNTEEEYKLVKRLVESF